MRGTQIQFRENETDGTDGLTAMAESRMRFLVKSFSSFLLQPIGAKV